MTLHHPVLISHMGWLQLVTRIDLVIGLFCKISSLLSGSFEKETCNLMDPTDRSHPIGDLHFYQAVPASFS